LSLLIFVLLPTRTVRPDTTDLGSGVTADLYRNMIAIDGPAANAAPSLHVSLTCLLAWALCRDFPRWSLISVGLVGLVWLSTLLTRQHHLIDVATGILLATLVAWPRHIRSKKGSAVDTGRFC
jgi:membrane-associated phospholipid phosphatase